MAYASSLAEARQILQGGFPQSTVHPSSAAGISRGGAMYRYSSSHSGADVSGSTGFFTECGAQPPVSSGAIHPHMVARSTKNVAMRVGDQVMIVESSAGVTAGKVTWHTVVASTFNGSTATFAANAGYNCSVST
jgi:hypothetical protein